GGAGTGVRIGGPVVHGKSIEQIEVHGPQISRERFKSAGFCAGRKKSFQQRAEFAIGPAPLVQECVDLFSGKTGSLQEQVGGCTKMLARIHQAPSSSCIRSQARAKVQSAATVERAMPS